MIDVQSELRISAAVVCADLGDEVILLNTATGIYFGLDPVGASIWGHLAAGLDLAALHAALLAEYDVDPEQLRADLHAFLELLRAKGLILLDGPA